jgi:hypothetical protein
MCLRQPPAEALLARREGKLVAADPVTLRRERELSFIRSPAFTAMLDRKRPMLARLSDALCNGTVPA